MPIETNSDVKLHVNKNKKKYLLILVAIVAIAIIVALIKIPSPIQKIIQKQSSVEIKTTYKNPFDKNTQYVNPFDNYKNPFVTNR